MGIKDIEKLLRNTDLDAPGMANEKVTMLLRAYALYSYDQESCPVQPGNMPFAVALFAVTAACEAAYIASLAVAHSSSSGCSSCGGCGELTMPEMGSGDADISTLPAESRLYARILKKFSEFWERIGRNFPMVFCPTALFRMRN